MKASEKDMKCFREHVINSTSYTLLKSINCTEKPPGTHENTSGGGIAQYRFIQTKKKVFLNTFKCKTKWTYSGLAIKLCLGTL